MENFPHLDLQLATVTLVLHCSFGECSYKINQLSIFCILMLTSVLQMTANPEQNKDYCKEIKRMRAGLAG